MRVVTRCPRCNVMSEHEFDGIVPSPASACSGADARQADACVSPRSSDGQSPDPEILAAMFRLFLRSAASSPYCHCGEEPYTRGDLCTRCEAMLLQEVLG